MKAILLTIVFVICATMAGAQNARPMHVALMFDDGPTAEHMDSYLALFRAENVRVTFSFVAQNVEARPLLARAAIAAGHEVANHSYTHKAPGGLPQEALDHEVIGALDSFRKHADIKPVWYWPPYIAITPELEATVARTGMKIYRPAHLVGTRDYDMAVSAEQIRDGALDGLRDGSLILFHEWRKETLEQMPAILAELKKRGVVLMTISELTEHR